MTDAEILRRIADWFDGMFEGTGQTHVQEDLRRIADRLEELDSE